MSKPKRRTSPNKQEAPQNAALEDKMRAFANQIIDVILDDYKQGKMKYNKLKGK